MQSEQLAAAHAGVGSKPEGGEQALTLGGGRGRRAAGRRSRRGSRFRGRRRLEDRRRAATLRTTIPRRHASASALCRITWISSTVFGSSPPHPSATAVRQQFRVQRVEVVPAEPTKRCYVRCGARHRARRCGGSRPTYSASGWRACVAATCAGGSARVRVPCSRCSCGPATPAPLASRCASSRSCAGGVPSTAFPTRDWIAAFVDDRIEAAVPLNDVAPHGVAPLPVDVAGRDRRKAQVSASVHGVTSPTTIGVPVCSAPAGSAFGGDRPHTQRPGRSAAAAAAGRHAAILPADYRLHMPSSTGTYRMRISPFAGCYRTAETRTSCGERLSAPGSALRRCCRGTRGGAVLAVPFRLFGFQRGVTVGSRSQLGLPA